MEKSTITRFSKVLKNFKNLDQEQQNKILQFISDQNINPETKNNIINLFNETIDQENQTNLESQSNAYNGRVKVLSNSGNGSTKSFETDQEQPFHFDSNAFIDVLILTSITATFSLISFIIIFLYALK